MFVFVNCQVQATGKGGQDEDQDEIVIEVKEVGQEDAATSGDAQEEAAGEIPQAEAVREVPPTAEEIASA